MKDVKNIDSLFNSTLKNYEAKVDDNEWQMLNSKLSRFNFFKFSISSFNIYYAVFILCIGTISSYYLLKDKNDEQVVNFEKKMNETKKNDSLNIIVNNKNNVPKNFIFSKKEVQKKKLSNPQSDTEEIKDTMKASQVITACIDTNKIKPPKVIRKTVQIKRNPIVIKDTIRINN